MSIPSDDGVCCFTIDRFNLLLQPFSAASDTRKGIRESQTTPKDARRGVSEHRMDTMYSSCQKKQIRRSKKLKRWK